MAKTLIIAATSAREYVQAAVDCGYKVIALDAFVDAETRAIATQTHQLKFDNFVLDVAHFKQIFSRINLGEVEGFIYGSVFDGCPHIVDWLAKQLPIFGNSADTLKQAKGFSFFALLDSLNIEHPQVQVNFPDKPEDWLSKQVGGCGGMHVQPLTVKTSKLDLNNTYFQKKQAGTPISMLFVADGQAVHLIGFNQQLTAPTKNLPYRFAGAVSNVTLHPSVHKMFERAAQKLTSALHLRGICSLDAIVQGEDVWMLELNPRLSATFQLYENLLPLHLQSCTSQFSGALVKTNASNAQLILYAEQTLNIPQHFVWPDWVGDIPCAESGDSSVKINQHMPICSVFAQAESAELAQNLVQQRAKQLRDLFE